jgi:drug/metabolite transporter (DMT)-like permease
VVQLNIWLSAAAGLASAVSWGAGDFCGGVASKRVSSFAVVIGSQLVGAATMLALALATREPVPAASSLVWCGVAGLAGAAGLLALYRALAIGRMGVAAPVSGVLSAAIPVIAGTMFEGPPALVKQGGFVLALAGVWLVARTDSRRIDPRDLGLPVAAGICFGLFIVTIARASGASVFWALVAARAASLALIGGLAVAARQPLAPSRRDWPIVALAGLFDAGGNAFLVIAAHAGRLDVAAVLSSLYPAATVLLAFWRLRERIERWQLVGLAVSLAAIVAITAG